MQCVFVWEISFLAYKTCHSVRMFHHARKEYFIMRVYYMPKRMRKRIFYSSCPSVYVKILRYYRMCSLTIEGVLKRTYHLSCPSVYVNLFSDFLEIAHTDFLCRGSWIAKVRFHLVQEYFIIRIKNILSIHRFFSVSVREFRKWDLISWRGRNPTGTVYVWFFL